MKKFLFSTILCFSLCLFIFIGNAMAQSTENKTEELTSGTNQTWTAPAGAWKIISLEAWGGGGGGGNVNGNSPCGAGGGGGGAHATYSTVITGIVPGPTALTYSVGAQVSGGNNGNPSSVKYDGTTLINVGGGTKGGTANQPNRPSLFGTNTTNATGGAGGTVTTGTGSSGASGTGVTVSRSYLSTTYPDGGAGGAGASGGAGGSTKSSNGAGNAGTAPGGGGSGARNGGSGSYTGGAGARGQINITYQILTLTVNFDANYTGGTNPTSQTVLYYDTYGTLPMLTRDNYIFVGWFTEATGGTQVTTTTKCTSTENVTLYAHWASTGAIANGSTSVTPCANFTVYNQTTPDAIEGQTIVYSWSYTVNDGAAIELSANKLELSQVDMSLDQMGTYKFTRYVNVLGQKVASAEQYTINVSSVEPGAIASGSKYICPASSFTIGSTTDAFTTASEAITYEWRYSKDGGAEVVVTGSNKKELTQADVSFTESGAYEFKRYATIGCAEAKVATGSYTLNVVVLPASYDAPTANFANLCVGGEWVVTGADYTLTGVTSPHDIATSFDWMISKDGGVAASAGGSAELVQPLDAEGSYTVYAAVGYFGQSACVVNTAPVSVTVVADPAIAVPTLTSNSVCPNGEVTMTAASIVGGVGDGYTYNWEFKAVGSSTWNAVSASEATYDQYTGTAITASNFIKMGDVQYRTYVSNAQGCDAYSPAADLNIIEVAVPVVRGDTTVCPEAGKYISFKATTTDPAFSLRWFENATTTTYTETTPQVAMDNELDTTNYVAQYNPGNGCVSARVPDAIYLTYSAHLQYVDASGDLDQTVCQNDGIVDIQFTHGGDCEPQITFDPAMPAGVTIDNSVAGITTITGTPTEAGTFTYHVALLPDGVTRCAAPNYYDGSINVNPVYNVTENKAICGGGYTIGDKMGHSYTFTESGTYTKTLEAVTGCDSVVTLNLYIHEWNQFGFKENEELIAGWTMFNSVASPISADMEAGSVSGSQITYSGWNGSNENHGDNDPGLVGSGVDVTNISPSSSALITADGHLLALRNHQGNGTNGGINNGKSIVIRTSTIGYGNLKMKFDYGSQRPKSFGQWSGNDKALTIVRMYYSTDGSHYEALSTINVDLEEDYVTYGVSEVNLTTQSLGALENANNIYLKLEFDGAASTSNVYYNFFLIDNLCISGEKIKELELTGETEACTNQPMTVVATAPYINTNVTPNDTTPVVYKWERIVGGASTVLEETSHILVDNDVQAGDYKYVVSVGEAPCGQSDTIDVYGIVPAYRLDIVRHGYVCSNEVDKVSNITFTDDCQYVDGMFIVTPTADEMRLPGIYDCQLSIPTTANPCDSIITLQLEVRKAFDTTIVANICLGETYTEYGFNITPTIEGISYHTSPDTWKCASGCDSVYHLTLRTNSVQQALTSESDVILAAWPMDNGISNYTPACGVKTVGSTFVVEGSSNVPPFANVAGHTPSSDYCYPSGSSNGALTWPNLSSSCSGFTNSASYTDYSGAYFEIKLNPYDYENLKLKFDYKRENASTSNAQAFNQVRYSYKFSETGSYTTIGTANITSTDWASQTLNFSSANTLDHDVVFLKMEFIGGNVGSTQSCGTFSGSKYLPSYITVDNVMIWGDRPARATLDGTAQICDKAGSYVCEGEEVTFTCQGDDTYFKFYVVDETAGKDTAFAGNTLTITPTQTTTYYIKAVEQTTLCDSVWGPFQVEVVKNPTLTLTTGTLDEALCGHETLDVEFLIENATSDSLIWLTEGGVKPDGISVSDDNNGNIALGGTLTNGGSARYQVVANPDIRCSTIILSENGTISTILQPKILHTIGEDTVCQDRAMQFVVDTAGLKFGIVPENQRFVWFTANDDTLGIQDTLNYTADEAIHSTRHYIQVKQTGGCTTLDSLDIVVYDLSSDTLRVEDMTYILNYGENYLRSDSLIVPYLMHNGEPVPESFIASAVHDGGVNIYPPSMDNLNTSITWTITDKCGNEHVKSQNLHFEIPPCGDGVTVTDKDGNLYHSVRIGLNCWMKENLRTTKYADETPVPVAMGYYAEGNVDSAANTATFGRLYTWYSATKVAENDDNATPQVNEYGHVQGVCPDGWYLPDRENFASLHDIEMNRMREAGDAYWIDGGGNNTSGLSLRGSGYYSNNTERCENLRLHAYFWTSDEVNSTIVKSFMADCHCYSWQEIEQSKGNAFSIRCLKEKD